MSKLTYKVVALGKFSTADKLEYLLNVGYHITASNIPGHVVLARKGNPEFTLKPDNN